jgi:GTP-binding protein
VGKSSLFNALIGEDRVIVSNVPGTTRDAIDTVIEYRRPTAAAAQADEVDEADDEFDEDVDAAESEANSEKDAPTRITLIDTAGIRKRGSVEPGIEKFSVLRSFKSIARADVALLLIDAVDGVLAQDEHVAGYVLDENKSVIVLVNKWDLVEGEDKVERTAKHVSGWGMLTPNMQDYVAALQKRFNFMPYVPILFISAKLKFRIEEILPTAIAVNEARNMRITTSQLMNIVREASLRHSPPLKAGRRLKVYLAQQVGVNPPTFVFHVNDVKLVHFGYERYMENRIRDDFGYLGTPLRLLFRGREEE